MFYLIDSKYISIWVLETDNCKVLEIDIGTPGTITLCIKIKLVTERCFYHPWHIFHTFFWGGGGGKGRKEGVSIR